MSWIIVLVVIAAIVFWVVGAYNRLVSLRNKFKNAFAQIDVQLKRRYDLIPNLVETAKAYMKHERETLENVIRARNSAVTANTAAAADPGSPQAIQGLMVAEGALTGALSKLFALAEAYPDLKANQNMMQLTEELTGTENKISFSRQAFNDSVMSYNTAVQQFPTNVIAGAFTFTPAELLQSTESEEEKQAVRVSFELTMKSSCGSCSHSCGAAAHLNADTTGCRRCSHDRSGSLRFRWNVRSAMVAMWVMFAFGVGLIAWGVISIRRGTLWDNEVAGEWIRLDDDPTMFWTAVSLIFTLAVLAIGVGAISGYGSRPL